LKCLSTFSENISKKPIFFLLSSASAPAVRTPARGGPTAVAAAELADHRPGSGGRRHAQGLARSHGCAGARRRPRARPQESKIIPTGSGTLPWWSPSLATEYRPPGRRPCAPAPAPPLGGATSPRPAVKPQRSPKSPRL
jgi:hypothetical protein